MEDMWWDAVDDDILGEESEARKDEAEAYGYYSEDIWSDVDADADTLVSAGWGTDEDYGSYDFSEPPF